MPRNVNIIAEKTDFYFCVTVYDNNNENKWIEMCHINHPQILKSLFEICKKLSFNKKLIFEIKVINKQEFIPFHIRCADITQYYKIS
jgi:hypothetical protein